MKGFAVVLAACASTATAAVCSDGPVRLPRPAFPPPVTSLDAGGTTIEIVSSQALVGDELATRRVRWRSPALVANALTFELYGSLIVTGYGFTAEPDYL